jgi:hypothetical protein
MHVGPAVDDRWGYFRRTNVALALNSYHQLSLADFTVWAPLTFAADGNVSSIGFVANFTVSVGT